MRRLPAYELNMPAAMAAGQTDFLAMGMDRAYCGAPAEATAAEGATTLATLTGLLVDLIREQVAGPDPRLERERRRIGQPSADADLNLATAFLDRNLAEGRGEPNRAHRTGGQLPPTRSSPTSATGSATRSSSSASARSERVLLALADSVEFVAPGTPCRRSAP